MAEMTLGDILKQRQQPAVPAATPPAEETAKPPVKTLRDILAETETQGPESTRPALPPAAPQPPAPADTFTVDVEAAAARRASAIKRPTIFGQRLQREQLRTGAEEEVRPVIRTQAIPKEQQKASFTQLWKDEIAAAKDMGAIRYVGESLLARPVAGFVQSMIDPVIGLTNTIAGDQFTYSRPLPDGRMFVWSQPIDEMNLARYMEKAGVLHEATMLGKLGDVAGHTAGFAIGAKPVAKLSSALVTSLMKSAAGAGASRFAVETAGLTGLTMLSQAGTYGRQVWKSPDMFLDAAVSSTIYPVMARSGEWANTLSKKIRGTELGQFSRHVVTNGLMSTVAAGTTTGQAAGGGISQAELEDIIASTAGMYAGFQIAGTMGALYRVAERRRTQRGLSHQTYLALKAYEEQALSRERPISAALSPETAAAIRRDRARGFYENSRTRLSGPVPVTWQDLARVYKITKSEAKKIIAEGISDAEVKEIGQARQNQGALLMIEEKRADIEAAGLDPNLVRMEAAYMMGVLDPLARASYKPLRDALETMYPSGRQAVTTPIELVEKTVGRGKKKETVVTTAGGKPVREMVRRGGKEVPRGAARVVRQRSMLERLREQIPTPEEVSSRARSDPDFESAIDGIVVADPQMAAEIKAMEAESNRRQAVERDVALARAREEQLTQEFPLARQQQREAEDIAMMERELSGRREMEMQAAERQVFGRRFGEAQRGTAPPEPGPPTAVRRGVMPLPRRAETGRIGPRFGQGGLGPELPGGGVLVGGPTPVEREPITRGQAERLRRRGVAVEGKPAAAPAAIERLAGPFPNTPAGTRRAESERMRFWQERGGKGQKYAVIRTKDGNLWVVHYPEKKPAKPPVEPPRGRISPYKQMIHLPGEYERRGELSKLAGAFRARQEQLRNYEREMTKPETDAWMGFLRRKYGEMGIVPGEAVPAAERLTYAVNRAMKILKSAATKSVGLRWLDQRVLEAKPTDPKGYLDIEFEKQHLAENRARYLSKLPENVANSYEFTVESMMAEPPVMKEFGTTGPKLELAEKPKDIGPWKIVPRSRIRSAYDLLDVDILPINIRRAMVRAQSRRLTNAETAAKLIGGIPTDLKQALARYIQEGGKPMLLMGVTSAGLATLARREDEDGAGAVGLAALPFFLRLGKKKGQGAAFNPFEAEWGKAIREARVSGMRARIERENSQYADNLAKANPREAERIADELRGKVDPTPNGIEAFYQVYEMPDGSHQVLSGPQFRRAIDKGWVLRKVQEWEPGWRELAEGALAKMQTGMGLGEAIVQPVVSLNGIATSSLGNALGKLGGPAGEFLNIGIQDATQNMRVRMNTLMNGFVSLPFNAEGLKQVDLTKPLNSAEEALLHRMIETKVLGDNRPPDRWTDKLMERISNTNREKVAAVTEWTWRALTGEEGVFWKGSDAVMENIKMAHEYFQVNLANEWGNARKLGIVHEDFGFLNPGGGYLPVLFRPEVHPLKPHWEVMGGMLAGGATGATLGALAGFDEDVAVSTGAFIGGAAGAAFGGLGAYRNTAALRDLSTQWRDAIAKNAEERQLTITDPLTMERRLMNRDDVIEILNGYQESKYNGLFSMPLKEKFHEKSEVNVHRAMFLEKSRLLDVLVGRELNPYSILPQYFEAAVRRVEMARVFGPHYELAEEVISALPQGKHIDIEGIRDLFDAATGSNRWLNTSQAMAFFDRFARPVVTFKLGLGAIAQTGSWARTATSGSAREWVKQWWNTKEELVLNDPYWSRLLSVETRRKIMDKQMRQEVAETGAALFSEYANYYHTHGRSFLTRASGQFLEYNMMMPLDRIGRFHGALVGRATYRQLRGQYEAALRAGDRAWAEKKFEPVFRELFVSTPRLTKKGRAGIDAQLSEDWVRLAMRGKLTPQEAKLLEARAGAVVVARSSGRTEAVDLPVLSQHPVFRHYMTLQTFSFRMQAESFNYMRRQVRLAMDGKPQLLAKSLAKLALTSAGVYYGVRQVRRAILGKEDESGWLDALIDVAGYGGWFSTFADAWREIVEERYGDWDASKLLLPGVAPQEALKFLDALGIDTMLRADGNASLKLWLLDNAPEPFRSRALAEMRTLAREDVYEREREKKSD